MNEVIGNYIQVRTMIGDGLPASESVDVTDNKTGEKSNQYYKNTINTMIDDFISEYIKSRSQPIRQFSDFSKKFDFKIGDKDLFEFHKNYDIAKQNEKEIQNLKTEIEKIKEELNNPDNNLTEKRIENRKKNKSKLESELQNLTTKSQQSFSFMMKNEKPNSAAKTIESIKQHNASIITELKKELFELVNRFNQFTELQGNARLIAHYASIDLMIEKLVSEVKALNNIVNKEDLQINDILNATESLYSIVNKIKKTGEVSGGFATVELKISKIMKLSNEITVLKILKENIFSTSKNIGLYVYIYDKPLINDSDINDLILDELKKEKYAFFRNTIQFIKESFLVGNRKSINNKLEKMMNDYFNNINSDLYDKIIEPANKLLNQGIAPEYDDNWNVSVTKKISTSDEPDYEITVYMEVIIGIIDNSNKSKIQCDFLDEKIVKMFEELITSENNYELKKSKNAFDIKEFEEKQKEKEIEKQKELKKFDAESKKHINTPIAEPVVQSNNENIPVAVPIPDSFTPRLGGKKTRRKRRNSRRHRNTLRK